jgi:surface-adhesin protein E
MHRSILAVLAVLGATASALTGAASAQRPEAWIYAGMQGSAMGWEASAIRRNAEAGTAATTRFMYFVRPQQDTLGEFNWALQDIEFDCRANTFRLVEGTLFNEHRSGITDQPASEAPVPVRAGTPEAVLKQVLCDNLRIAEALTASSMTDAMDGAEKAARR